MVNASLAFLIIGVVLLLVGVIGGLISAMTPQNAPWLSEGNEPDLDCDECKGTGTLYEGDSHFEMNCPCTDRFYF